MFEKIKLIKKTKKKNCYDIHMQNKGFQGKKMYDVKSNFVANGIVCKNSGGDARASFSLQDTFSEFSEAKKFKEKYPQAAKIAEKLEGHIRHKGIHAAAMIASKDPIFKQVPINKVSGKLVTEWEKQSCEDMKLVKFDILGLNTLALIQDCIDDAGCKLPKTFDDMAVYKNVFHNNNFVGIFQFAGTGMQKFASGLEINTFNELYDATTLFRPGCISGDTRITKHQDQELFANNKIKNLALHRSCNILEVKEEGFVERRADLIKSGEKYLFRIIDSEGNFIDASEEHKFLTDGGWKKLKDLEEGDEIYRAIPEEKKDYVRCRICNAKRKNLARNHLHSHGIKPSEYKGDFFTEDEEKNIKKQMSKNGKKGFIAQQKTLPYKKLQKMGTEASKTPQAIENKRKAQLRIRDITSAKRKQFLKDNPDKHPAVILAKNGNISYQQKKIYNIIKRKHKDALLEEPIPNTTYSADVLIPSHKLIIEYDGKYWHDTLECKEKDRRRDKETGKLGYRTIRINKDNIKSMMVMIDAKIQGKN